MKLTEKVFWIALSLVILGGMFWVYHHEKLKVFKNEILDLRNDYNKLENEFSVIKSRLVDKDDWEYELKGGFPKGKMVLDLPIQPKKNPGSEEKEKKFPLFDDGKEIEKIPQQKNILPPIEFIGVEIEPDYIVFCVDRTGSMSTRYGRSIVDENDNKLDNATKMKVVVLEMKKTISRFSESVRFNIVFWCSASRRPGNANIITWKPLCVPANTLNKLEAGKWIDKNSKPYGATNLSDGCRRALEISNAKTVLLVSDGYPNVFQGRSYSDYKYCGDRSRREIREANRGTIIHAYYIQYGSAIHDARCRELMQKIASENGGQFTEIGR